MMKEMKLKAENRIHDEQKVLKVSIVVTMIVAIFGVTMGVFTGSSAIIFDGIYCVLDCLFSIAALAVARLLQLDASRHADKPHFIERFQHGFWHFEPLLLFVNGACLIIAVFYGFFEATSMLLRGGHAPSLGWGVTYGLIAAIICYSLAFYEGRKNRTIKSAFITIDVRSWVISGSISLAVFIAFIGAYLIEGTTLGWFIPYIDPLVLIFICLIMVPVPLKIVRRALQDVFMITPAALDEHVTNVVEEIVKKYGFTDFYTYVARVGRSRMIEIHLVLPAGYPIGTVEFIDKVRGEIGDAIGGAGSDRWLTVSFTAQEAWAL